MTQEEDEDLLNEAAYILGSRYRKIVIAELEEGPTTPTGIAERHDVHLSHISRALSELHDRGIVESHSDGSRTKLYAVTDLGTRVAARMDEFERGDGS